MEIGKTPDAQDIARFANANPDLFPGGLSHEEASWIVANQDKFTDGEP